jgi:hypothetical protein
MFPLGAICQGFRFSSRLSLELNTHGTTNNESSHDNLLHTKGVSWTAERLVLSLVVSTSVSALLFVPKQNRSGKRERNTERWDTISTVGGT